MEEATKADTTKQELGLFSGISNEDYHKGSGISSSSLKQFIKAPKLYQAYKTGAIKFNVTASMDLGTAVHKLVLETEDFFNEIIIEPDFNRPKFSKKPQAATLAKLEIWADFDERANGKLAISPSQYDKARYMADSIFAHPEAQMIFRQGEAEQSGYYQDWDDDRGEGTFMLCKYRPDWRRDDMIVDVKTCRDASENGFKRQINDLGYHISAAHYIAGDRFLKETKHRQFIFVCVEPEPPYLCATYVLDDRSLQLGEFKRRQGLNRMKQARKDGAHPSYNEDVAVNIELPPYLFYEMEKEGYYRHPED